MIHLQSIKTKILGMSISAIFLTASILVVAVLIEKVPLKNNINDELDKLAKSETSKIAHDVYLMCRSQNELIQTILEQKKNSVRNLLPYLGEISLGKETVSWTSTGSSATGTKTVRLPVMSIGGMIVGSNAGQGTDSTFSEKLQGLLGGSWAIFERINEAGDLLLIDSSGDDSFPVGTMIPSVSNEGTAHPLVLAMNSRNTYNGRVNLANEWCFGVFEPLMDVSQNVIGALYVGIKENNLASLQKGITEIQVGKTGYVFTVQGSGAQKGRYIISKNGERNGENIWDSKDSDGRFFIQSIIQKALPLKNGSSDFELYPWKNEGENQARTKITAVTYFEPWDWVIGAGTYQDDFMDTQIRVDKSLSRLVYTILSIAILLILVFGIVTTWFSGRLVNPLLQSTAFAKKVADGDLRQRLDITQKDEIGELGHALNDMVGKLNEVSLVLTKVAQGDLTQSVNQTGDLADAVNQMGKDLNNVMVQIQNSARQVASSSEELSSSAQSLSSSTTEQASALEETSASIEQLAASVDQNAHNSRDANAIISKAAKDAEQDRKSVV